MSSAQNDESTAPNVTQAAPPAVEGSPMLNKTLAGLAQMNDYYYKTVMDTFAKKAPVSAPVPVEVTVAVEEIIAKGLEGGGPPNDNRVNDIVWGWQSEGVAERQKAVYYRLNVSENQSQSGFSLHCRSKNKSKLRVFVYDKNGNLADKADAFRTRDATLSQAILVFSSAPTLKMEQQSDDPLLSQAWGKTPNAGMAITTPRYYACYHPVCSV